jgi:nucleoside diphosphate kinase
MADSVLSDPCALFFVVLDAKKDAPNSIRALFASSTTKNSAHGSDSTESAIRELDFYFNTQQTLALIKPDAVESKKADEIIQRIEDEQFLIIEHKQIQLTKDMAEAFYA